MESQFIQVASIFILTHPTRWNPSSSHESFYFANLELSGDSFVQSRVMRPQKLWVQHHPIFCFFMFSSIFSPSWSPYSCWIKKQLFHNHHSPSPWSHSPACISQLAGAELGVLDATFWRPWSAVHAATWHLVGGGPAGVDGGDEVLMEFFLRWMGLLLEDFLRHFW